MENQLSESVIINGINTSQLKHYISLMGKNSPAGIPTARLRHTWKKGFVVEGSAEELREAGKTQPRFNHTFKTDWPEPFSGDSGLTPGLELLLSCAGACAATTFAVKASLEGIEIEKLEVITEGKVDLKGLFELDANTPARLLDVNITLCVASDADKTVIQKIIKNMVHTSPVLDTLINPVSIELSANMLQSKDSS